MLAPMCQICHNLEVRVQSLACRIDRWSVWSEDANTLMRMGYKNLLKSIEHHLVKTGHDVDSCDVILALGRKTPAVLAPKRRY